MPAFIFHNAASKPKICTHRVFFLFLSIGIILLLYLMKSHSLVSCCFPLKKCTLTPLLILFDAWTEPCCFRLSAKLGVHAKQPMLSTECAPVRHGTATSSSVSLVHTERCKPSSPMPHRPYHSCANLPMASAEQGSWPHLAELATKAPVPTIFLP